MQNVSSKSDLQALLGTWKHKGQRIGLVPTMGALHEGHLSLIEIAKNNADKVIASIFVNPKQFAPHEDFDAYPRDVEGDLETLKQRGVDAVYLPERSAMYPDDFTTHFTIGGPNIGLDSDHRPHFFNGVAVVVCKLFNQVRPDIAVFGEKDYQQLMVIRQMVKDLDMDVEVLGGPLIRDENGLALSSRNQYLSEDEYEIAVQLNTILAECAHGKIDAQEAKEKLLNAGFDQVDYIEERWGRILAAGWVGKTRLLDNFSINQ